MPPFSPSGDDRKQQFQVSVWYLDPREPDGVAMESGPIESFVNGPFYLTIVWDGGGDEITVLPRERVVRFHIAPVRN